MPALEDSSFEQVLLDSIDDALLNLGESCKTIIYSYLASALSLKKYQIPENLEGFAEAVREIFRTGTTVIDGLIINALCEKLDVNCKKVNSEDFVSAVEEIKNMAASKG
jgi:hypothetical protein